MEKKERRIVFSTGLLMLLIFTFTDLQISNALFTKNLYGRIFEVIGELPFVFLSLFGSVLLFRFRSRKNRVLNLLTVLLSGVMMVLFLFMGGFMTLNYLRDNVGEVPEFVAFLIAAVLLAGAIFLARKVPEEYAYPAVTYGIIAMVYFILVIIIMNSLKTVWGRMRLREMTDPVVEFTRWYVIVNRGGFENIYASFPSGHSMNSAAIILLTLLPSFVPMLEGKEKLLKGIAYTWTIIVGSSRIVMGAHFASDVTVGILLSFAIFDITHTVVCKLRNRV